MKKTIIACMACIAAVLLFSCSGLSKKDSPKDVVEKYSQALIEQDWKAAFDLVYFKGTPEEAEKTRQQWIGLCEEKAKNMPNDKIVTAVEVIDEQINEEAGTAVVTANITYGNGNTKEEKTDLIRTDDGQWLLDMKK